MVGEGSVEYNGVSEGEDFAVGSDVGQGVRFCCWL